MILFKNQRQRIAARILEVMGPKASLDGDPAARVTIARWLGMMPGAQMVPRFLFDLALWDLLWDGKLRRANGGLVAVQ